MPFNVCADACPGLPGRLGVFPGKWACPVFGLHRAGLQIENGWGAGDALDSAIDSCYRLPREGLKSAVRKRACFPIKE